ncbi:MULTISPECIES: hypothetical protein [Pseudomonas]|uniref:hypothetical protein n=1 Tax=Pseudomonas TaxID=286 RepID=UPI000CEE4905|nr:MULTISPECIES: hypothetical protein [Pseudomonas]PPS61642.1 hypothetical protein CR917_11915 [Pseudomonas sp. BRM28]WKL69981.1 hypothetical protein Q1Z72_21685 [Pseudomonas qingdaonensis]
MTGLVQGEAVLEIGRTMSVTTIVKTKCSTWGTKEVFIMPQYRQFLGVNSVTNIELGKGVMPVPIIRNAHWFEKFSFGARPGHLGGSTFRHRQRRKDRAMRLKCASFPFSEHSGYAV